MNRKTILSAMSVMASLMMFAAGSSDANRENGNREQNQAIVGEIKRIYLQGEAEVRAVMNAEHKERPKSKGMPLVAYVMLCNGVISFGLGLGILGKQAALALRKKREGRTG